MNTYKKKIVDVIVALFFDKGHDLRRLSRSVTLLCSYRYCKTPVIHIKYLLWFSVARFWYQSFGFTLCVLILYLVRCRLLSDNILGNSRSIA